MKPKEKKIIQGLVIFGTAIVIILSLVGDKGLLQFYSLKKQESQLKNDIKQLKSEKQDWISKINSLKTNLTYIETIAREEMGMVRSDEVLVLLKDQKSPSD